MRPIFQARFVRYGTVADLKMKSGRVYRAIWEYRGRCCAWWPDTGQARKSPIGLYEPISFIAIADGIMPAPSNRPG